MSEAIALDEDIKRCVDADRAADRELAAARDRVAALAANENMIPPIPRVAEVIRSRDYEHGLNDSRRHRRNRALTIKMSLLLCLMAGAASVALFLWGMRYINGA